MGSYKQQLNEFYKGEMKREEVFSLGQPAAALRDCGMTDLEIIMTQKVANKVTRPEGSKHTSHGISRQIMKDLKKQLENPVMVFKNPEKNALIIVTDKQDNHNLPVVIAIHNSEQIAFEKKNVIKSIYGRVDFENYLLREERKANLVFTDKKRAEKLCRSVPLQLREETPTTSYNQNIPHPPPSVNTRDEKTSLSMAEWQKQIAAKKDEIGNENEITPERNQDNGRKAERTAHE